MTGAELAAIRKAAGLSQIDLAGKAGISRHTVSYWECKAVVDFGSGGMKRIAGALGLPVYSTSLRAGALWADTLLRREAQEREEQWARFLEAEAERAARRRVRCGARTRKGKPCRNKSEPGKRRCKFHGGKSTGARTPEGIERIREAQRRRWARWRAARGSGLADGEA